MTDELLKDLLRSALPPANLRGPSRDLWAQVVSRIEASPAWSWLDTSVAVGVTIALLAFPKALLLIAFQL
jgi:hypothetical protein